MSSATVPINHGRRCETPQTMRGTSPPSSTIPRGDARFKVTTVVDGTREEIERALRQFARETSSADVAVVYFSGHGFEHEGTNYVVPIDAPVASEVTASKLGLQYMDVQAILSAAEPSTGGLAIVFLDACRVRPEIKAENTKGLERASLFGSVDAGQAVVISATGPGRVAYDAIPDDSPLSPFATAIGNALQKPDKDFPIAFSEAARDVFKISEGKAPPQKPTLTGFWTRPFYFSPPVLNAEAPTESALAPSPAAAAKLDIPMSTLATVDETVLVGDVLNRFSPQQIRDLAQAGNPVALWFVGYMLYQGVGFARDIPGARAWLEKAAATGHPGGQLEYAYYLLTYGEPADKAEAGRLYRAAADRGYAKAQTHYATHLERGTFGPRQPEEARRLLRAAAASGHINALAQLAGERDGGSIAVLQKLARAGNREGDHWLCAVAKFKPIEGAAYNCLEAARVGYANSRALTALRYASGDGLPKSTTDARNWARLALPDATLDAAYAEAMRTLVR